MYFLLILLVGAIAWQRIQDECFIVFSGNSKTFPEQHIFHPCLKKCPLLIIDQDHWEVVLVDPELLYLHPLLLQHLSLLLQHPSLLLLSFLLPSFSDFFWSWLPLLTTLLSDVLKLPLCGWEPTAYWLTVWKYDILIRKVRNSFDHKGYHIRQQDPNCYSDTETRALSSWESLGCWRMSSLSFSLNLLKIKTPECTLSI